MNPATQEYLRKAAIEALSAKDDAAARELLSMLGGLPAEAAAPEPVQALPAARQVTMGPAHDLHFWAQLIREQFLPFLEANGRRRFTSPELFFWLDHCRDLPLTSGDMVMYSEGRLTWRCNASNGLAWLKSQGIVAAPAHGKEYEIRTARLLGGAE